MRTYRLRAFPVCAALLAAVGCVKKGSKPASAGDNLSLDALAEEGEPVRLALVSSDALALNQRTLRNLIEGKALIPTTGAEPKSLSRQLFTSLSLSAKYANEVSKNGEAFLRHDVFAVEADISHTQVVSGAGGSLSLPFGLAKGTEIRIARSFPSESEARTALPFDLSRLPVDAEHARAMKPGDYLGLPCRTNLFLNVNGVFLQRNWQRTAALLPFFQNALTGSLSAVPEGHLLAQGVFQLHVLRGKGDEVRVRITTLQGIEAGAKATFQFGAQNHYTFLPGTRLAKIRGLKTLQGLHKPESLSTLGRTAKEAKDFILPPVFAQLQNIAPAVKTGEAFGTRASERLSGGVDLFVQAVDRLSASVDDINARTVGRFNALASEINSKSIDKVQQAIDHTIDISGAVDLGANFARGIRLVGDYRIDLGTLEGRLAFDRIVSGRVVMQARDKALAPWKLRDASVSDFSYADELAMLDASRPEGKRVVRMAHVVDSYAKGDYALGFRLAKAVRVLGERWRENEVAIASETGDPLNYKYKQWEFEDAFTWTTTDRERKSSGLLFATDEKGAASGAANYFYAWHREYPPDHTTPLGDALRHVINVTGPAAFLLGLPERYGGEFPGRTTVSFTFTFLPPAVASFFDARTTTHAMLWQAFASTTHGWLQDERNKVPLLAGPFAHMRLAEPYAKQACAVLQADWNWGGGYCNYFNETFLPKWDEASKGNEKAQLAFLAHFYTQGFLANKVGGDLLARFVSEVLYAKHGKEYVKDLVLNLDYENTEDASEVANPDFKFGEDPASVVVDTIGESFD